MLTLVKNGWHWFTRPNYRLSTGLLLSIGIVAGVVLWASFNAYVDYTDSIEFCISCHEMKDTVYQEYSESVHYKNASGVRVLCSDCHVPKQRFEKILRKIQASNELYHKIIGSIDTAEKFEAKRLELAEHVWESMRANDSRECRNCHSYEAMDFHKQSRRSQEKMQPAAEKNETCIECHQGIAHKKPDTDDD